jgi:hypothetical protein
MYLHAESITVESDEGRTVLEIMDGESGKRLTVNIHDCDLDAFYDQVKARIGPYLRERDEARRTLPTRFECDPDESGGYDLSDPKHAAFHSTHSDLWDVMRDGK